MPRRGYDVDLADGRHHVVIDYKALTGFMSIEVDGQRVVRGWREFQTIWGAAKLTCSVGGRRIDALVTQPLGQGYRFALQLDGVALPGSDAQTSSSAVNRSTLAGLAFLWNTLLAVNIVQHGFVLLAAFTFAAGVVAIVVIERATWPRLQRALVAGALTLGWPIIMIAGAVVLRAAGR